MSDRPDQSKQPTDLLTARAGQRPSGFFEQPGVRKFVRNRPAVGALTVIAVFLLLALLISMPGVNLVPLERATERVGPDAVPGFFVRASDEKRAAFAAFWVRELDKSLRASDPEQAIAALAFAERRIAPLELGALRDRLAEAQAMLDGLDEAMGDAEDARFDLEDLAEELAGEDEPSDALREQERELREELAGMQRVVRERLVALEDAIESLYPTPRGREGFAYRVRLLAGTDGQGRSLLLRAVYSIKVAVQIGVVTALLSVFVGTLLGAAAGYIGGPVDHAVVWLYSTISSIPYIVWLVVVAFVVREINWTVPILDKQLNQTLFPVYAAFVMNFWVGPCRVIRGEALKIRGLDYVQAATAVGCGRCRVLLRHVLPNTTYLVFINFSLLFVGAIKGEVILSFLGLGVQGQPSWGIMIRDSQPEVVVGFFWQLGIATAFMFVLVLAFNIVSDALQDAFDPKHVAGEA
ncbi:MAG TPA: ABC transporter permease [Phycisphaerales bacterium]|nr:ABC transporter permease [Phycisphaerales bacterium]